METGKNKLQSACKSVKNLDFYAEDVTLRFRRRATYTTWVGTFFSIGALTLLIGFAVMTTSKLVSREDPFLSTHMSPREDTFAVDLKMLGYMFAIQ